MEKVAKGIEYFLFYYITAWFADTLDPDSMAVEMYTIAKNAFDVGVAMLASFIASMSGLPIVYAYFLIFATITYVLIRILGQFLSKVLVFAWVLVVVAIVLKNVVIPLLR